MDNGDDMGPCQPSVPDDAEVCGNNCDENANGLVEETCAGSKTFDYCEPGPYNQGIRWTCACGEGLKVGRCLGSNDSQTSCSSATGCLKAPFFGTTGGYQAGGDYQCCVSSLPCDPDTERYIPSAMHCEKADSLRFECAPGTSCDDSNACGNTCTGLTPSIDHTSGELEGEGAYCAAGPVCSAAQGGFGAPNEGGVSASIYRTECGTSTEIDTLTGTTLGTVVTCRLVSRPGLTLSVPPSEHGDTPRGREREEGGGRGGRGDGEGAAEVNRPAPDTGNACGPGTSQAAGVASASVSQPQVSLSDFTSRYSASDLGLRGTLGGFNFVRKYVSTDNFWSYQSMLGNSTEPYVAKPFGSSPTRRSSLRWWHSLYSMVYPRGWVNGVSTWAVRDTEGSVLEFTACTPGTMSTTPCFATPRDTTRWSNASLLWTGSHFVLIKPGDGRFVYNSGWSLDGPWYRQVKYYFLTRVEEDAASGAPRVRLSLTYETPVVPNGSGGHYNCPGLSTSGNGVPYLKEVTTEDGAKLRLRYRMVITPFQDPVIECVLDSVALRTNPNSSDSAASQQEVIVAKYVYPKNESLPAYQPTGLLSKVEYPETGDVVSYDDTTASGAASTSWGVSVNEQPVAAHVYQSGKVSSVAADGTSAMVFSTGSGNCDGGPVASGTDGGTSCVPPSIQGVPATAGDSAGTTVLVHRSFSTQTSPYSPHPLLRTELDRCLSGNCTSFAEGWFEYDYEEPEDGFLFLHRWKDKAHRYVERELSFADAGTASVPGVVSPVTRVVTRSGQDYAGDGGVPGPVTDYVYSDSPPAAGQAWRPVKEKVGTLPSVFNPGAQVLRRTRTDEATGFTKSIIQSGFTHQFDAATGTWNGPVVQHLGVFYFNHHKCLGEADTGVAVLKEVHGPCAVSGPEATDCSGTDFPITQYHYHGPPSAERSNRANRLMKVSEFLQHGGPTSCAGSPSLETRYEEYDARGNPTRIVSSQGVVSTVQYAGGRITQSTTGGLTLTYLYEGARLRATRTPAGVYQVRCYRKDTLPGDGCRFGRLTDRLQWEATASDEHGADWSQMRVFEYWPNGAPKSEKFRSRLNGVEETRRVVAHHPDPHLRPTFTRWGEGPGSYSAASAFDVNDNPVAAGSAFNNPPDFCRSGGASFSPACTTFAYDTLNRLTRASEFPSDTSGQHATFEYDAHGNVRTLRTGCASPEGAECGTPATYRYDDFGLLAEAWLPNARGPVRYAYDARGNRRVKQTPAMLGGKAFVAYEYDLLSRLKSERSVHWPDGYQAVHYRLGHDNEEAPPAGCASQLNSLGRLRFRQDNFGRTWYQYDAAGRVVREMRIRAGATACGQGLEANPDTHYTYDAVGRLVSVTYPHGRTVSYVHGTGAHADAVSAIDVTQYDGSGWQVRRIISGVVWEPFGGLRGYQMHHAGSGTVSSAEYMQGDNASVAPASSASACASTPPAMATSDLTGRLRALRVSSGAFSPGTGTGDILNRTYTWAADQVRRVDTCVLDSAEAQTELFSYDRSLRLTGAGRPTGNFAATGGAYAFRTYGYDRRGNRTSASEDGTASSLLYWESPPNGPDSLGVYSTGPGGLVSEWYFYDSDGRFDRKLTARSGPSGGHLQMYPQYFTGHGFLEGVFQAIYFDSGTSYNYYYDALGRRRLKVYPTGTRDEYFHAVGNQLLSDSGPDDVITAGYYVEDDYVWLGRRPVAVLRGKFSTSWARQPDDSTECARAGTPAVCGLYFLVTDHLGKPVLTLDDSRRISGLGEYDPFGHVNRVSRPGGTSNPYGDNLDVELVRYEQPARSSQLRVQQRVLFDLIDTEGTQDYAVLEEGTTGAPLAGPFSGQQSGKRWSGWVESGSVSVRFVSDATSASRRGVVVRASEYRRFQQGATPFWVPLRFPGQYHDAETDLFESWNRYYDPDIGRFLQPEPLLAAGARALPAYAYALNNPLYLVDMDGLAPVLTPYNSRNEAVAAGFLWVQGTHDWKTFEYNFYVYVASKDGKWRYSTPVKSASSAEALGKIPLHASAWCHTHRPAPKDGPNFSTQDASTFEAAHKTWTERKLPPLTFYLLDAFGQIKSASELSKFPEGDSVTWPEGVKP